ncbi:amidohydrolase family protein [Patulibacter defluvii]|uniref:amidohydrolase family protein n=1 Tax=Patulibacter defluvii TaxID=3095358 RepID=UPI002A74D8A8|nr:amidohydrolase family protein [Patulibacter sp. DM4]
MSRPLVISGSVLLVDADAEPLRDAALLVRDGAIAAVGPAGELRASVPEAQDGGHHDVLLPGLIDAHSHARRTPLAAHGIGGGPLERFLVALAEATPLDPRDEALRSGADGLATGITATQALVHDFGDEDAYAASARAVLDGYGASGARAALALGLTDRDEWGPDDVDAPARGIAPERFAEVAGGLLGRRVGRATIDAVGPVAPQWCSDRALAAIAAAGARRIHAHLLESPRQRLLADVAGDPLARLDGAGLLGPATSLAHGVWLADDDVARLAASGAVLVHNPGSNELIGVGRLPLRERLDAGLRVAFGCDSHLPTDPPDAFAELRRAIAVAAARGTVVSAREALRMAWAGGAAALVRDDLGRLAVGARADVVALRLPAALGAADPRTTVVTEADRDAVARTWVDGELVFPWPATVAEAVDAAASRASERLALDAAGRTARRGATAETWSRVDGAWRRLAERAGRSEPGVEVRG